MKAWRQGRRHWWDKSEVNGLRSENAWLSVWHTRACSTVDRAAKNGRRLTRAEFTTARYYRGIENSFRAELAKTARHDLFSFYAFDLRIPAGIDAPVNELHAVPPRYSIESLDHAWCSDALITKCQVQPSICIRKLLSGESKLHVPRLPRAVHFSASRDERARLLAAYG